MHRTFPKLSAFTAAQQMRLLLLPLAALLACSGSTTPDTAAIRPGILHYSALSATGQPLLVGRLTFQPTVDAPFSGTWQIRWAPGADTTTAVGPQVGSGVLVGEWAGGKLLIQLNPANADHNVTLQAASEDGGYSGRWEWSTFAGPRTSGTFVAAPE